MKKLFCSQIYSIDMINLINHVGCAKLNPIKINLTQQLCLIWKITDYPMEHQGMPGSPYTVQVNLTIFDKTNYLNDLLIGQFIYHIHSGTLVKYSSLGIPYGTYIFSASSTEFDVKKKIMIILTEQSLKLIISN